jgi:hypothetical protein
MKLYPERLNRDFNMSEENDKLLSAYERVIKEQYMLDEDSTEDAKKTLDAIVGATKEKGGDIHKMAVGMKKSYEKNKGFSKDQAKWIYNTSQMLFKK